MRRRNGLTLSVCPSCGVNTQLLSKEKNTMIKESIPKTKGSLRTIILTSFFTALFLFVLMAGGAYWFVKNSASILPENKPIASSPDSNPKLLPRVKKQSAIAASEITKVEFIESSSASNSGAAMYFGNVNVNNYTSRASAVRFLSDGAASKTLSRTATVSGVRMPDNIEQYTGAFAPEKFATLAQVLVEEDFTGEEDSKTSTSLPISCLLKITYSSGEKQIKTSNSGKNTPEVEAILAAFKILENSVSWKRE